MIRCPKCGAETAQGVQATTASPSDEIREAFNGMIQEMETAFSLAAKEVQEAFQIARKNIQKTMYKEATVCPNCGEKNPHSAAFCSKCGKSLSFAESPKPIEGLQES
jgi:ribosomal protein L40E